MPQYRFQEFYIPERMMEDIDAYIMLGHWPCRFLEAVIQNDFVEICKQADDENLRNLPAYAHYLYNEVNSTCWGSKEKMKIWIESRRAK